MAIREPQDRDDFAAEPRSIDLRDYGLVVRRRRAIIVAAAILGAALGVGYGQYAGHTYAATAQVIVAPISQGPLNPPAQPNLQVNMTTEQAVAQSAPVAAIAANLMHSTLSKARAVAAAAKHLTVTVPVTSDLLQLTWQASSPQAAQLGANAFAAAYLKYRHGVLSSQITRLSATVGKQVTTLEHEIAVASVRQSAAAAGSGQRQTLAVKINQLDRQLTIANDALASVPSYDDSGGTVIDAALPLHPAGLSHTLVIVLGGLLGLLVGLAVAFARDALDDRVRDPEVLERKLGAPILAVLPRSKGQAGPAPAGTDRAGSRPGQAVITVTRPGSRAADAIRSLRATLVAVGAGRNLRTIAVVAADGSVSSSHLAAELGVALAESGRRTLLIAADIRGSALPRIFDVSNATGLTNLLSGDADEVLTQHPKYASGVALQSAVAQRLALISGGPRLAQPLAVLDSKTMVGLLKSRRDSYDYVVLDSPPADDAADFVVLAGLVDAVIVVGREGRTRGRVLEDLRQRLDQVGANLIGGVFVARGRARQDRRQRPDRSDANIINGSFAGERPDRPPAGRAKTAKPAGRAAPPTAPEERDIAPRRPHRLASPPS